jgi:hypothetical protein
LYWKWKISSASCSKSAGSAVKILSSVSQIIYLLQTFGL